MKTKRVVLWTAISLFFVIFVGLVFLPAILSSNLLKPVILASINRHVPGRLQVAEWRFKWFSGIEARGIVYDYRRENLLIEIAELKGYRGLAQLMADTGNLGGIEVVKPQVLFYLAHKQSSDLSDKSESHPSGGFPAFSGILKISDGSIRTVNPSGSEKTVAKGLDLYLDISDIKKPIAYRVFLTSGDTVGSLSGEGTLTLSANNPFDLKAIQTDARLKIANWEIEEVLEIMASRGNFPRGKGRLNVDLALRGSAAKVMGINGKLSVNRLELWGGPLGADHPRVKAATTEIDGNISQGVLSLNQLKLQSSAANGSMRGKFAGRDQNQLQGSVDINLAEVFSQLPGPLKLRQDMTLSRGKLAVTASVKSAGGVIAFESSARLDQLKGLSRGKPVAWNKPISLKARGESGTRGIHLDDLSLRSSFLNADGRGDFRTMQVTLSVDMAAAFRELRKFFDISEWDGSGKLFAGFQVKETAPDISTAAVNLDIRNLALNRNRASILPKQDVKADFSARVHRGEGLTVTEFQKPALSIQSSMARGKFSAARFALNSAGGLPTADDLSIDGNFNLQQISDLLQNFKILSDNSRLSGTAHIQSSASMPSQHLVLNRLQVDTRNFRYQDGQKTLRDDRLNVETRGKLNFETKSARFAPIEINGSAGTITIPELTISDWSDLQKDMKTQAKARLDLAKLTRSYGDFIQLPPKTRIAGKGTIDLDLDFSSPKAQHLKVDADLSPFQLTSDTLPPISEDHVKLKANLKRSPDGKELTIENIQLNSTPLSLSAAGNLDQAGGQKKLDASGNINLDLKMLSPYLQKIAGSQITITGKGDNPFKLKMVSGRTHWIDALKQTDFSGSIRADSIDAFGLKISATEVPLDVANESAVAKLTAIANGGRLNLEPKIDLKKEPVMLSLPPDSTLLKDVEITDAMAEKLMAKIHPVFQGSAQAQGHVDLYMQHFSWALDKKDRDKTSFAGKLRLKGVRVKSTNLLSGLLALIGIHGNEMDFGDLDIDFVARNGRIETSPIRLEIDGYPIELRGSVGFDRSLDYTAKLPITSGLVGDKAYRYLEGVTIDVPIRGNSKNPDIDESSVQKATADLAEQALKKSLEKGVQNILEQLLKK
ncbi:MAG: AsmA-like C-terminal region-containing protein [Deltaproteobacteria bacterium]